MIDYFIKRYPDLLEYSSSGRLVSSINCPVGWINLLHPIFIYLEEYNKTVQDETKKIKITCIKEKFAELVIYTSRSSLDFSPQKNEEFMAIVHEARENSRKKCMFCDEAGIKRGTGWIYVSCDEHDKSLR